jgi:histone arginine demethylase JMJD6
MSDCTDRVDTPRKLAAISRAEFRLAHLNPRIPLVLEASAQTAIPAVRKWDLDFFLAHYGERHVPIDGLQSGRDETLKNYIGQIRSRSQDEINVVPYMRNLLLFERFPELRADFDMPWIANPNWLQSKVLGDFSGGSWRFWVELFLSGEGSRFPFVHIDPYHTHAWSLQISGRKRFWLWSPLAGQVDKLRDGSLLRKSPSPVTTETQFANFFPDRAAQSVVLRPGELLFLPAGWWHTTETSEESVTLGGNFVEASNWRDFEELYRWRNPPHSVKQRLQRRLSSLAAPMFFRCLRAP